MKWDIEREIKKIYNNICAAHTTTLLPTIVALIFHSSLFYEKNTWKVKLLYMLVKNAVKGKRRRRMSEKLFHFTIVKEI